MKRTVLVGAILAAAVLAAIAGADRIGRALVALDQPALAAPLLADPGWRGVALSRAGDTTAAIDAFRRSASPEAAYNLGNALARAGRLAEAVKAYDVALLRDPDDTDARTNRALVASVIAALEDVPDDGSRNSANATALREARGLDAVPPEDATAINASGDGMAGDKEAGSQSLNAGTSRVARRGQARPGDSDKGQASSKGAATDSAGRAGRSGGMTSAAVTDETAPPQAERAGLDEEMQATAQWLAAIPDDPVKFLRLRIAAERQRRIAAGTAVPPGGDPW
jgi:tetratricopeptide (TPR) repeat protein